MAKQLHLQHIKSERKDKAPLAENLNLGEIAINYNSESPAIYIKDNENNVVKFISEPYFEEIIGTAITENNKSVSQIIEEDEEAIAASVNDLNKRISSIPSIPSWATSPTKPSYTVDEVGALSNEATLDDIQDGDTRKLSDYTTVSNFNSYTGTTKTALDKKLDKTDFNAYTGSTQTAIASKVSQTDFNSYSGSTQNSINSKVSQTDFNTYSGSTQTSINSKASKTDFNTHTGDTTFHVTSSEKTQWNNGITGATVNGSSATVTNHVLSLDVTSLPSVTTADNGKVLKVVNGVWTLVESTTVYTGTETPSLGLGNDGDIYLQTS